MPDSDSIEVGARYKLCDVSRYRQLGIVGSIFTVTNVTIPDPDSTTPEPVATIVYDTDEIGETQNEQLTINEMKNLLQKSEIERVNNHENARKRRNTVIGNDDTGSDTEIGSGRENLQTGLGMTN